jgi:hypothetical protein
MQKKLFGKAFFIFSGNFGASVTFYNPIYMFFPKHCAETVALKPLGRNRWAETVAPVYHAG